MTTSSARRDGGRAIHFARGSAAGDTSYSSPILPPPQAEFRHRKAELPRAAIGHLSRLRPATGAIQTISIGVPDVSSHSFRKTIATLIDDEGLSARVGADQLGHSNVLMTQDRYVKRCRVHQQVANLMDRAVDINDE